MGSHSLPGAGAEDSLDYRLLKSLFPEWLPVVVDCLEGSLVYVDSEIEKILDYSAEEISRGGISFILSLVHPEDEWGLLHASREIIVRCDQDSSCRGPLPPVQQKVRFKLKSGMWCDFVLRGQSWGRLILVLIQKVMDCQTSEAGFRGSGEWLREFLALLPQTVFEVDLLGRIRFGNRKGMETFGLDEDDLRRGIMVADLLVPEDRGRALREIASVMAGGASGHEFTFLRKDGSSFPGLVHSTIVMRGGVPAGLCGILVDLSDRKIAEDELRRSESKYRALFENSGNPLIFVQEDMKIGMCNKAFESLAECSKGDVESRMAWMEFVADQSDLLRMTEYHRQRRLCPDNAPPSYEFRFLTRKGNIRLVRVTVTMIPGTMESLVVLSDVTEQRSAEQALKESETLYRAIFENTGNASIIIEEDTTIILANSEWVRISGYSKEELEGRMSWTQFVVPEDLERMRGFHRIRRIDEAGAPWAYEFRFIRRNGDILNMINHVAMIPGTRRSIASLLDFTDRYRAETEREQLRERLSQAEKLEAIGQLAGGVAHDFNNQLGAIMGFAEVLETSLEDGELRESARLIGQASRRAAELTRQLLAFARKGKLLSVPVDIHQVIRDVVALLQRSIDRRVEIRLNLVASPSTTLGDPAQIQNALMNLAINSRDAMPDGGVLSFSTELRRLDDEYCRQQPHEIEPGTFIQISVEDTGVGMDAETCRRVFEPFFTTKPVGKGTGLGLASVYGSVKQHRGAIHLYSEVGKGSCFRIFLPMVPMEVEVVPRPVPLESEHTGRILLVDDEDLVARWGARVLSGMGYHVDVCHDGREAVEFYTQNHASIDLVVLDIIMPRMGGSDVFRALRAINPDVKVIVSSGFSLEGEAQKLLDEGAKGFLQKPFQASELGDLIRSVLTD